VTSPKPKEDLDERGRLEGAWLERMRAGDERGFEAMFRAYMGPLCAFANSYLDSRGDAQEIVQDVFHSLWQHRFTVEMPRGMGPYLYAAVRNRALNVLRGRRNEHSIHERLVHDVAVSAGFDAAPLAEGEMNAKELAEAVDRVVAGMPQRCREVFSLLRYQHLSYADAATVLAISPKTVEVHMARALAILRDRLAPWLEP
jgi:RNA polymerase sigma-70 factor (ECF subfamily)